MLFQQLGEPFVFALEFLLQSFNLLLIPIRNSGAGLLAFKSGCSVLEKLSLPLVKHPRVDVVLVAQIRNGFAFNQMLAKNRDLLFRAKITSVVVVSLRLVLPASTSLRSAHDFPIPSEAGQIPQVNFFPERCS
jgi:hypothetical protein